MYDFESQIVDIPDYPEPGVIFKDITPLFGNPEALKAMTDALAEHFAGMGITKVVGPEARGFMVGVPVAVALGAGFVPARKPGKLPRETVSQSYELEYGTDSIEIHADAISSKDTVLILDDLAWSRRAEPSRQQVNWCEIWAQSLSVTVVSLSLRFSTRARSSRRLMTMWSSLAW